MKSGIGKREGYTLVELSAALAILGTMLALVWPNIKSQARALILRAREEQRLEKNLSAREKAFYTGHEENQ